MADKLKTAMISGILLIVLIAVAFLVWASLVPEAQTGGDALGTAAQCASAGCFYNESLLPSPVAGDGGLPICETSKSSNVSCSDFQQGGIPLSGLFSSDGVVFVIIMAAIFMLVLAGIFVMLRKGSSK